MNADPAGAILGHVFKDATLLTAAFTTPSYHNQHARERDNQRLEFLGDAVLGLLSAECLYETHPRDEEGRMSVCRSQMVSSPALCEVARRMELDKRLRRSKGSPPLPKNSKTLADAVEALMGAIYLDGGLDAARQAFDRLQLAQNARRSEASTNPKGVLQMRTQALTPQRLPVYEVLKIEGRAHEPVYTVRVTVEGIGAATATAGNRKDAEIKAAAEILEIWKE